MAARRQSKNVFAVDHEVHDALQNAQWTFGTTTDRNVYELRLDLATPAATTAEKANAPVIGLPTLDGFLSYVAFQAALHEAALVNPHLSKRLIWQWNTALRESDSWIDFQLPLCTISLPDSSSLFDCSIGLPIDENGDMLIPAGAFFVRNNHDLVTYPEVVDSIPLRRRVSQPFERPISLKTNLVRRDGSKKALESGSTKPLDNRLYFPLTTSYLFFFRGNKEGVERLLNFAIDNRIGIGKKTTLGYGQISSFNVKYRPDIKATWAYPILDNNQLALIKSLPFDRVYARRQSSDRNNLELFGCEKFALIAAIETLGTYRPPYWLRERRTQIVRYGSIIQKR
ncbi:hypothetical protein MNBD_CHLOROFLEXI01-247 [hydrothermal vent metagenome]|uniref:Uncharacterized protein n=1 Tax=hydrothermal vent metagenome TaxID=652676 RepID=A0A3B0VRW2_9ZZZZ